MVKTSSRATVLVAFILSLVAVLGFAINQENVASAGYSSFDQAYATAKDNIDLVSSEANSRGWSKAAIAGILGNMNVESSFRTNAQNGLGCSGMVQFCFARSTAMQKAVPDWQTNAKAQIKYTFDEMGDGSFIKAYNSNISWYAAEVKGMPSCSVADFNAFKKLDNPKCAAVSFTATHERCGNKGSVEVSCRINQRATFAQQAFDSGKISGAASSSSASPRPSASASSSSSTSKDASEDKLKGMPDKNDYSQNDKSGSVPGEADSLSDSDKYNLAQLRDTSADNREATQTLNMWTLIAILGFLLLAYALVIAFAIALDYGSGITNISKYVTFNRLDFRKGGTDEKKRSANIRKGLMTIAVALVIAAILLAGAWSNSALNLLWFVQDHTNIDLRGIIN